MKPESLNGWKYLAGKTDSLDNMRLVLEQGNMFVLRSLANNLNITDEIALVLARTKNHEIEENLLLNDSVSGDVIRVIHEHNVGKHDYFVATAFNTPKDILIQIACDNLDEEASVEARKRLDVLDLLD